MAHHALRRGPRLLVLGGVHGDESCGAAGIARVLERINAGVVSINRGAVTFVPNANPRARNLNRREADRNLNRDLRERTVAEDYEDRVANVLCRLIRDHDVLLDVHSYMRGDMTHAVGEPFVIMGPPNNDDDLEPFAKWGDELALAHCLGAPTIIFDWLKVQADAALERRRLSESSPASQELGVVPEPLSFGLGTTGYMRFHGGYGVTLECGFHGEESAIDIAEKAILSALNTLGVSSDAPAQPAQGARLLRMSDVFLKQHEGDRLARAWRHLEPVKQGDVLIHRAGGHEVRAPREGLAVMPAPTAGLLREMLYLAVQS